VTLYAGPVPCGRCSIALPQEHDGSATCICGTTQLVFRFEPERVAPESAAVQALRAGDTPCAYHTGNLASQACRRCGSFICSLWALTPGTLSFCPPCFERLRRTDELDPLRARFGRPHALAGALGLLALGLPCLGLLAAPAAIWLGLRALRRRADLGQREPGVALTAIAALCLGTLSLVLHVALLYVSLKPSPP